jgi:hypothetical protein
MSDDDLVTRLEAMSFAVCGEAAARITELEAENAAFREQFADADEVRALLAKWGATGEMPEGWQMTDYRAENARLREAGRELHFHLGAIRDYLRGSGRPELAACGNCDRVLAAWAALSGEPT